jgi:hypothetical protein
MKGGLLRPIGAVLGIIILSMVMGCTNAKEVSRRTKDPLKFEYDSFQPVSAACLTQLKDTVAKRFGTDYAYKNTINSREPGYREAIFSRLEGAVDSALVVKFDSSCVVKRIFSSKMMVGAEEYH